MLNNIGVAGAAEARQGEFGALVDGTKIASVELANGKGVSARIITLGAAIQQLMVPDRQGKPADVVLGYATAQQYLDQPLQNHFSAEVGRLSLLSDQFNDATQASRVRLVAANVDGRGE